MTKSHFKVINIGHQNMLEFQIMFIQTQIFHNYLTTSFINLRDFVQ